MAGWAGRRPGACAVRVGRRRGSLFLGPGGGRRAAGWRSPSPAAGIGAEGTGRGGRAVLSSGDRGTAIGPGRVGGLASPGEGPGPGPGPGPGHGPGPGPAGG